MSDPRPPMVIDLSWDQELVFTARAGANTMQIDSEGKAGPSPMQALAIAVAGCMSMDIVHILTRGRKDLRAFRSTLTGVRAGEEPRRFLKINLHLDLDGDLTPEPVERAIALSREKYCSVWHSMRQDIELTTSFSITGSN